MGALLRECIVREARKVRPTPETAVDVDTLEPTWADIEANMEARPDPTGDRAAGRTHFHPNTEEFLACLDSLED